MTKTNPTPTDTTQILALLAYTDHKDHALALVFPASDEVESDFAALKALTRVAPDPDGWLTFDRVPFQGTLGELKAVVKRLPIPGFITGAFFPSATPAQALAVAQALVAINPPGESAAHSVREYIASFFLIEGLGEPWASAVAAAAPGFDSTNVALFSLPGDADDGDEDEEDR